MPEIVSMTPGQSEEISARLESALRQGGLVVVPTDVGMELAASALDADAVKALAAWPGLLDRPVLALSQPTEIWDWLPYLRSVGYRLARSFWPGPLTLVARGGLDQGLWPWLPLATQDVLMTEAGLPIRVPKWIGDLIWPTRNIGPIVAAPIDVSAVPLATIAGGNRVGLVVTTAATVETPRLPTRVEVHGNAWRLMKAGAIPVEAIEETGRCRIVFVCTGNTCRSPLAAALCRKLLADRIGCNQAELSRHGFMVESAGLAALHGAEATPEAVTVAAEHGADLRGHESQGLSVEMLACADHLLTMTQSHLRLLESLDLNVGPRPRLLSVRGEDVEDPLGGGPEVYHACADQLLASLRERLPEFLET